MLLDLHYHTVDYEWKRVVKNESSSGSCLMLAFWGMHHAAKPINVACSSAFTSLRDCLLCSCSSLPCDQWWTKIARRSVSHLAFLRHANHLRIHPEADEMLRKLLRSEYVSVIVR